MKKRVLSLIVCIMIVASFVACGGPKTLETYYGNELTKKILDASIDQQMEEADGMYSDISYEVTGNTLTYQFYFAEEPVFDEAMKATLESSLEGALDQTAPGIKAESKITDEITVGYIFYNPDGSEYINISKNY